MLKDQNEEIRKFAIRNLREISDTIKKVFVEHINFNVLTSLINYLFTTTCKKEIFEITTIIINATFQDKKVSVFILTSKLDLVAHLDNFLSNFEQFDNLDFHIAVNYITIITNLLSDNNLKKLGFEQHIFERFNIAVLFRLFISMLKLPNFIRIHVIWLFTNCLKVKQIEKEENATPFLISYWSELEKFLSKEANLDILIKFFNFPTSKLTTEILNFLLALYDLENEAILTYLHTNLNFENKISEILKCFQETRTLILAFKLINNMSYKYFFDLRFFDVYDVLHKMPYVFEYIEKDLLKYAPAVQIDLNSTNHTKNKLITQKKDFNPEMLSLLSNMVFFIAQWLEKKSSVAHRIFTCDEMFMTINNIFMLITRNYVGTHIKSALENYLLIICSMLNLNDNAVYFFEFIRCNVLDFLTDIIKKVGDDKDLLLPILNCFDMMLGLASDLVEGSKNFVALQLEKHALDSFIDKLCLSNEDEIAAIANTIIEIYFKE